MYSPQLGRFLSPDPLAANPTILFDNNWFGARLTIMRNLYGYSGNNPVNVVDPSGLQSGAVVAAPVGTMKITVVEPARALSDCGRAVFGVRYTVTSGKPTGWVLQHVTWKADVEDCKGNKVKPKNPDGLEYTEGWQIVDGVVYAGFKGPAGLNIHKADIFLTADEGDKRKGTITLTGNVKGIPNYNLTVPPWGAAVPQAGNLPSIKPTPPGWSDTGRLHRYGNRI